MKCRRAVRPVVALFLIAALFLIGGCAGAQTQTASPETVKAVSSKDVLAFYQSIITFPRSGSAYPRDLNAYILEQAEILGVDAEKDDAGNVIMRAPATTGNEKAQPVVLLAYTGADIVNAPSKPFDPYKDGVGLIPSDEQVRAPGTSMGADGALGVATILSVLKFSESHGEITAVFANGTGTARAKDADSVDDLTGKVTLKDLPFRLPENALLIEVGGADTNDIVGEAPTATLLTAKTTASAVSPGSNRAYVISASGFPDGTARIKTGKDYTSPISIVTRILSETRNAGCVYQLCDFSGGTDACALPGEAQATVILGDYEERQFRKVFESVVDASKDALGDEDSGASINMIETVRPDFAIGEENVSNALTYLYGLMNLKISDAENADASLNIGEVKFDSTKFECDIAVVSAYSGSDAASRIVNDQSAFERLSGIPVEKSGVIQGFSNYETEADEGAADAFANAYEEVTADDVHEEISDTLSPLGRLAQAATVKRIGITVHERGTPEEYFDKDEAAIPVNVILRYLEA